MSVESARKEDVQVGDEMPDGTALAGYYEGKPFYTTLQDATQFFGLTHTFNLEGAQKYAKNLDAYGHNDWRVPSKGELNVLWENRNKGKLAGTSNETVSYWSSSFETEDCDGWYCSSLIRGYWVQRFSDGGHDCRYDERRDSPLRCVRG